MRLSAAQMFLNIIGHMEDVLMRRVKTQEEHQVTRRTQQKTMKWEVLWRVQLNRKTPSSAK